MKIAIVVNSAWAAYNFRSNLASSFESLGHKVTFIVPFDAEYSDKLKKNFNCKNYYLNAGGLNPFQDIKTLLSLSSDINFNILIEYINLLNEAEINFQKSLNQRLLIELSILKISSLEFNEEKKKFKYRLIPISNFQSQVFISQYSNAIEQKKPKPIANLSVSEFQTSTLSLKSIEKNKEINDLDLDSEVEYSNNNELILEDIIEVWDNYTNIQEEKGRYNIASILRLSSPKFKNNTIIYSVPNNTTSLEIDSEKQNLLLFLRNKLESDIGLLIEIDKKMDENKAYTNKDKFEVLKKKNPLIDELRNTFKLSI